jgi:transcriptional regulator GlxA family with amidase domain
MKMPIGAGEDRRVKEVLAFISAHYWQPLTREVLARRVNLSPSRLHSLFQRHANTTPRAAILAKRMEKAAELLRTTHLLVKEVAAKVGIQDDSHFVRDFAKFHGLGPTAYRHAYYSDHPQVDSPRTFVPGAALDAKASVQTANR